MNLAARRQTPPNAVGRGPLVAEPGFGVAIVAIVRNEAGHLEEWLAFHLALGVDHVFLYDNRSTDDSATLLERYIDHGLVTRLDWPQLAGQRAAYNHALRMFGSVAEWLIYVDVDEFVIPLVDDDIPTALARFPRASDVRMPRREFAFSGHRTPPRGLTIESYTQIADVFYRGEDAPPRVKTALRPRAIAAMDVHLALVGDAGTVPDGLATVEDDAVAGILQVNHYYTRSLEEYEAKRVGGSATGRHERQALPFDIPTIGTDETAFRFVSRTHAAIDDLRALDPRPHAYGSRLRLEHFPRANDIGRHGEILVATVAAGLDDPMGYGKVRIRNLYPGIGFVGDLGKAGRAPVPAGLRGSAHLDQLLEPLRARLDAAVTSTSDPLAVAPGTDPIELALPTSELRRCYAVGFLVEGDGPLRLDLRLERLDGSVGDPVIVELRRASAYAGIVELEDRPGHGRRVLACVDGSAPARLYDLFAISYG
jgi:hypothetical protein